MLLFRKIINLMIFHNITKFMMNYIQMTSNQPKRLVFFIILMNSSSLMAPSPSRSASSIISCSSSCDIYSPSSLATLARCFTVILSELSSMNSLKAFIISSTGFLSAFAIKQRKVAIPSLRSSGQGSPGRR